jgi:glycosyltransferase involved in cell wall biosynthesis
LRIAFITAGAAGMFCGSCMRDNTLVAALGRLGHDAVLVPTYTPIRTDEADVSQGRVFYGGIAVYLEQKAWLFRHTPRAVDWVLNRPRLLQWVSRFAVNVDYADLGDLTVSMLQGGHGRQRKELAKLTDWLRDEVKPDVVLLTNALLSGIAAGVRKALGVPVLTTLQGDDIFLEALPKDAKARCVELIRENDGHTDGYVCTSRFYADFMAGYLGVNRGKMHVVYPGIDLKGHALRNPARDRPPVIGYFARICPEKGFHNLVEAFIRLRKRPDAPAAKLKASGWLGESNKPYFAEELAKLEAAGLAADFEYVECPTHADKVRFLQSLDVFSVPTDYHEPKGLYVLEAWANGVPVVQPRHGSFPELVEATGGGLLCGPADPDDLADKLLRLLADPAARTDFGGKGRKAVVERFSAEAMAANTLAVLNNYVRPAP